MRLLFCYTLQGQKMVTTCINNIKQSRIPFKQCRFFYCDDATKQYLLNFGIKEPYIIQTIGLGLELDSPLNTMRISKNKPDYFIVNMDFNTRITRYASLLDEVSMFQTSLANKLCLFTTSFMYPCKKHIDNRIDSRVFFCNNIHKNLLTNYIDTCQDLDKKDYEGKYTDISSFTDELVLENMSMDSQISINFSGLRNQTLFQQFFLTHFSDYD